MREFFSASTPCSSGCQYCFAKWGNKHTEFLQVDSAQRVEDGTIVFHLYIDDGKTLDTMEIDVAEDGSAYFTPKQALLEPKRTSENGLFNTYLAFNVTQDTSNYETHYWIGTETGLLTACERYWQGELVYRMTGSELTVGQVDDAMFLLPDGNQPS